MPATVPQISTVVVIRLDETRTYLLAPPDCPPATAWEMAARAIDAIPGRTPDEGRRDFLASFLQAQGFQRCGAVTSRIKAERPGGWRATGPNDPEEPPGLFIVGGLGATVYLPSLPTWLGARRLLPFARPWPDMRS